MAFYDEHDAKIEAYRLVQLAVEHGLLTSIDPTKSSNPAETGKEVGQFLGGLMAEIASQLQKL